MMMAELDLNNIKYDDHQYVKCAKVVVDIIVLPSIIIECDGLYWHTRPGRKEIDQKRTNSMVANGYKVYRFTDKEIYADVKGCVGKVIQGMEL